MEQSNNKKKIIGIIVGGAAFLVSYFAVQQLFFKKPTFDKVLMEAASELNKNCPFMVDSETRLDNAIALPDNMFRYNYTLINLSEEEVDTIEAHQNLDATLINSVKTNPDLKLYRDNKVTMSYHYRDKDGKYLMRTDVTPELYQ